MTLLLDATTDGPMWTIALGLLLVAVLLYFAAAGVRDRRAARDRSRRVRAYERSARDASPAVVHLAEDSRWP